MAKFYQVGGCVRDELMGVKSKDIDYSVEAPSYEAMRNAILDRGGRIFVENPEFFTVRAKVPQMGACDFVLCRRDGEYTDGRRPDEVLAGSLMDDLARRDFTMNAIAKDEGGTIIDPFNGQRDIEGKTIRCVGLAEQRFTEDALRLLRAIRFSITKSMAMHVSIQDCLRNPKIVKRLASVSVERVSDELTKALACSTLGTLTLLERFPLIRNECFSGRLKLLPTLKQL